MKVAKIVKSKLGTKKKKLSIRTNLWLIDQKEQQNILFDFPITILLFQKKNCEQMFLIQNIHNFTKITIFAKNLVNYL
jgi:hypothetical protein